MLTGKVLVAVPAYNEVGTVGQVVAAVLRENPDVDVLVVDDGSVDQTADMARRCGAVVVTLPFNVGVGGAMRTAFLYAVENNYSVVVQVDADGQHPPDGIPHLCETLARDNADVVVGARFVDSSTSYETRGPRRWAMVMLSQMLSKVTGTELSDTTSGFRASGPRAIKLFAQHYPSEYLGDTVESLLIAHRAGLKIVQTGVQMKPRQGGEASQNAAYSTLYLGRALLALSVALTRRRSDAALPELSDTVAVEPVTVEGKGGE